MALSPNDIAAIRAAEKALAEAFEDSDPTAWVDSYTHDAVFAAPGLPTIEGRAALLAAADVDLVDADRCRIDHRHRRPRRELRSRDLGGRGPRGSEAPTKRRRFLMVWRKDPDGRWRIARELLNEDL